jgi:hypothetical protein
LRPRHAVAPFRRLRVAAEREPRVLVAELVGRVPLAVAADAPEARVRAAEPVERTFSTFAYQALENHAALSATYVSLSVGLGIAAVAAGRAV